MITDRKLYIGGSDAAPILGLSKWQTPYQTYLKKRGEWEPEITPERQELFDIGNIMEPVIRDVLFPRWWNKNNSEPCDILYDPTEKGELNWFEYPYPYGWTGPQIGGNLDGIIVGPNEFQAILECKTADKYTAHLWGDTQTDYVPPQYACQCQHYMMITGLNKCYLAVLIGGNDFRVYTLHADYEFHKIMLDAYINFWRMVQDGTPPESVTLDDNKLKYPQDDAGEVVADDRLSVEISILRSLKSKLKDTEKEYKEQVLKIQTAMAEKAYLVDRTGNKLVSWKTQESSRVDVSKLKEEYPEIYKDVVKVTSSRVFRD